MATHLSHILELKPHHFFPFHRLRVAGCGPGENRDRYDRSRLRYDERRTRCERGEGERGWAAGSAGQARRRQSRARDPRANGAMFVLGTGCSWRVKQRICRRRDRSTSASLDGYETELGSTDIQYHDGGAMLWVKLIGVFPFLPKLYDDCGYQGPEFQKSLKRVLSEAKTQIVNDRNAKAASSCCADDRCSHAGLGRPMPRIGQGRGAPQRRDARISASGLHPPIGQRLCGSLPCFRTD